MRNDTRGFQTDAIHAGEAEHASSTPISLGATSDAVYYRTGNPTLAAFEAKAAALDNGTHGVSAACGMAAVSQTLLTLLSAGSRLVCHHTVYHWSRELLHRELPRFGVEVVPVDMRESAELAAALETRTDVVYFEPLSNPTLDIVDAPAVIAAAHAAGARAVVDATWLSPYLFRPLEHGADAVIHSATKFLCGHGDALAGVVVTRDPALAEDLVRVRNTLGGILGPMNAYLLMRGMKTLPIRMRQHCANAQAIAEYLERHPKVTQVWYPGLAGTRGHGIARAQWSGFGGMLGFALESRAARDAFLDRVELCKPWVSLGDAASLVHDARSENRIRMSVGLEDCADIERDLEQAIG